MPRPFHLRYGSGVGLAHSLSEVSPSASLESLFSVPVACLIQGAFLTKSHQAGLALGVWSILKSIDVKPETIFSKSGLESEAAPISTVCPRLDLCNLGLYLRLTISMATSQHQQFRCLE